MAVQIAGHQTPNLQRWKTVSQTDKVSTGNNRGHFHILYTATHGRVRYLGRCNYFIVIILPAREISPAKLVSHHLQWPSLCLLVGAQTVDLQILCKGFLNDLTKIEAYNRYILQSYSKLRLLYLIQDHFGSGRLGSTREVSLSLVFILYSYIYP